MITKEFADGLKLGLQATRNRTYSVEEAINNGDLSVAQREVAFLVGQAINCQAVLAAKLTYGLSERRNIQEGKKDVLQFVSRMGY